MITAPIQLHPAEKLIQMLLFAAPTILQLSIVVGDFECHNTAILLEGSISYVFDMVVETIALMLIGYLCYRVYQAWQLDNRVHLKIHGCLHTTDVANWLNRDTIENLAVIYTQEADLPRNHPAS